MHHVALNIVPFLFIYSIFLLVGVQVSQVFTNERYEYAFIVIRACQLAIEEVKKLLWP